MNYNFVKHGGSIKQSNKCIFDSNVGYEADFSENGNVDGWSYYDGIHTYGCWNNFLFGTLYGSYAVIGRLENFRPFNADKFNVVRLALKLNIVPRVGSQKFPKYGRLMWRTFADPIFSVAKSYDFELFQDKEWHTYSLNLSDEQLWQGEVNDLRIYPILQDGRDDDEFFIRVIEVLSVDEFRCLNPPCDYYTRYEHGCAGIGERGYCKSIPLKLYVEKGVVYEFSEEKYFDILDGENDVLLVNINDYGFEHIKLKPGLRYTGSDIAKLISRELARVDIGGYCDNEVIFTQIGEFVVYSGTRANDSNVVVGDSNLSRYLGFFDTFGNDISIKGVGRNPASGFVPYSSFSVKTGQIYSLVDSGDKSSLFFNPFLYNVEFGRSDWLETGLTQPTQKAETSMYTDTGRVFFSHHKITNVDKTIIDITHPFNNTGRIKKVFAAVTLDVHNYNDYEEVGGQDRFRKENQLVNSKVMFFRPMKDGTFRTLPFELNIENRKQDEGKLYSTSQEYIEIDCDLFVNKGDVIGIYNANFLVAKSLSGKEIDATYYQVNGKASGILQVREVYGSGNAGLLIYARSDQIQNRLVIEVDLGNRINVEDVSVDLSSDEEYLEFNIARCLDVNFEVDLFDGDHTTGYVQQYRPTLIKHFFNHPNLYYGKECLRDGIKIVKDGLASDSFSTKYGRYYYSEYSAEGKRDGGAGVVPVGAKYFMVNGDMEWIGIYLQNDRPGHPFDVGNFSRDPIAISMFFPHNKSKLINKSKFYFKEKSNFKSFALSTFVDELYSNGTSDDCRFDLIPYRTDGSNTPWKKISLDGVEYTPEDEDRWESLSIYLAENPCTGHMIIQDLKVNEATLNDPNSKYYAPWDPLHGLVYNAVGQIANNEQYTRALGMNWLVLEHEWEPIKAKGFRVHCVYHNSCSICELEVFCVVENVKSSVDGSVELTYSHYGDRWLNVESKEAHNGVNFFIGDTPRLLNIVIKPIVELRVKSISISPSSSDVYIGDKGCEHSLYPISARLGYESMPQVVKFRNVYGNIYDLYVSIAKDGWLENSTVFYSTMENAESIHNPEIGADAYFKKSENYKLLNDKGNVAINCPVYALKNLVVGSKAWYSYDYGRTWNFLKILDSQKNINFTNLKDSSITTINIPSFTRSNFWKIGFLDPRVEAAVSEIKIFYKEEEISGVKFYYHKNQDVINGSNFNLAPHLGNGHIDGSYYTQKGDNHIGFELPSVQPFDRIVIYNNFLKEYENSHNKAGIDSSTALCIHGEGLLYQTDSIIDYSYYEHNVTTINAYCDDGFIDDIEYSFSQDFSDYDVHIETFDHEFIDTEIWTDLVNASIYPTATVSGVVVSGTLSLHNDIQSGSISTVWEYSGDFDANVELDVIGALDLLGWGCYLEAYTDGSEYVRVGKTFNHINNKQSFVASHRDLMGYSILGDEVELSNENLTLRIVREGVYTYCYADSSGFSTRVGNPSTAIGVSNVKFRLTCERTPLLHPDYVINARFDNFYVEKPNAHWGINSSNNSSFYSTELTQDRYVYEYDIGVSSSSNAAGYHIPILFYPNFKPLDNEFSFVFDFSFKTEYFLTNTGVSTNDCGVSVGLINAHSSYSYSNKYVDGFRGAQVMLKRDQIGIVVCDNGVNINSIYRSLNTTLKEYFCRLTSDGLGNYRCMVWDDQIDGINKLLDFTLFSSLEWWIDKIGVGSGYGDHLTNIYRAKGWVSDFNFSCSKISYNFKIGSSAIRFFRNQSSRLIVDYNNGVGTSISKDGLFFSDKDFTIDFFVKFYSLPIENGDYVSLVRCWDDDLYPSINSTTSSKCSFYLMLERSGGSYKLKLYHSRHRVCRVIFDILFNPDLHRWYHLYLFRRDSIEPTVYIGVLLNGYRLFYDGFSGTSANYIRSTDYSGSNIIIGDGLDGFIQNIRISSDYTPGGCRVSGYISYYWELWKSIPTSYYERYYTIGLYNSIDNITYGKSMDVDVLFDNSFSYHLPFSKWCEQYYTYFAIDLKQRHALEIVRSFPRPESFEFSLNENVIYSNKDVDTPNEAFSFISENLDVSNDFSGQKYDHPDGWVVEESPGSRSYLIDGYFYQICNNTGVPESTSAVSEFSFNGDFSFYIDFSLNRSQPLSDSWGIGIEVFSLFNSKFAVKFEIGCSGGSFKRVFSVRDNSSSWLVVTSYIGSVYSGSFKFVRNNYMFSLSTKGIDEEISKFLVISSYQMKNDFGKEAKLKIYSFNDGQVTPKVEVFWDNFTVLTSNTMFSNSQDTRWLMVSMLNGDGVERKINNLGVYSNIAKQTNVVGQYNNYWDHMGSSITSYSTQENIALGATVSGSSYVGYMRFENIVDGDYSEGDINLCWGSEDEINPYVDIHLRQTESIYRVVIYHGFTSSEPQNLVTHYEILVSVDGSSFSKIFSISNNSQFYRVHDLSAPVYAKVVRIRVLSYKSVNRLVFINSEKGVGFWKGAVIREVEVYKYYGFTVVDSEDYPIIAVNLRQNYFINGHDLIGISYEDHYTDWDNDVNNFSWSNSNLDDPEKVVFREWGDEPEYDKWVVVKRNTATRYPIFNPNALSNIESNDFPDFLKYIVVTASVDEFGTKPNPFEYWWMWKSLLSNVSSDYSILTNGVAVSRSLRIDYPSSYETDHISFIEGDTFGYDDLVSWRDAFEFSIHIDDINNLDLGYGYFYVGGFDYTESRNPVIYEWDITSISGSLHSGWNHLGLILSHNDRIKYSDLELLDKTTGRDPRRPYSINWGKMGFVFRGKGKPLGLNIEGAYFKRSYFELSCFNAKPGLYLHGSDIFKIPLSDISPRSLSIEFWIRPDWNFDGRDFYGDFRFRSLFHMGNVSNDILGASISVRGIDIYYGNLARDYRSVTIGGISETVLNRQIHMAFVFSCDGNGMYDDYSNIRVYLDNFLIGKVFDKWNVSDDKHFNFFLGGTGLLLQKINGFDPRSSSICGVLSRLKIHNYCKLDYSDIYLEDNEVYDSELLTPSKTIQISKDNVTYHSVDSRDLPFVFKGVKDGEYVDVWVKTNLPREFSGGERRVANILGSWDIGV